MTKLSTLSTQDILFTGATVAVAYVGIYVSGKMTKRYGKITSLTSSATATLAMTELKKRKLLPKALTPEKKGQ